MKEKLLLLFLSLLLASCAARLPFTSDYPLTNEMFRSREGVLAGKVPQGWFSSTEDTVGTALSVWLIKEDFSATLTLRELKLDQLSALDVEKNGLGLLARLSREFQPSSASDRKIEIEEFSMNGNRYCAYTLGRGADSRRIILFGARGRFFECEARPLKGSWTSTDLKRLFTLQQTVLSSLQY